MDSRTPPSSGARLRRAADADVPALVRLVERAYRGEASRAGWTTEADLLGGQRTDGAEIAGLVAGPGTRILVAEQGGQLVGSVLLAEEGAEAVYVGMLAVEPTRQGGGLGRQLLDAVEACVERERLGRRLRMTVIAQRPELIAWYVRRGYAVTGERRAFPYGEPRFGLPKRPDLYFEVLDKALW